MAARLAGLTALCLLAFAPAAMAADFTWSGAGPSGPAASDWTNALNWTGAPPTAGATGNFIFPSLSCVGGSVVCGSSVDDLAGDVTATSLAIDDGTDYAISAAGFGMTLTPPPGTDGLTATTTGPATGEPAISIPLTLGNDQSWSVTASALTDDASLAINGAVTGNHALAVHMGNDAALTLAGVDTVGAFTATGADTAKTDSDASDNGSLTIGNSLNAGGLPVSVSNLGLQLESLSTTPVATGPLTLAGDSVSIGQGSAGIAGGATSSGAVSIDADTLTTLFITSASPTPTASPVAGADYSQLNAAGNIAVGGNLQLFYSSPDSTCPTFTPGTVYTLLHTTGGTISGTFSDAADGEVADIDAFCGPSSDFTPLPVRIDYSGTSITATALGTTTTALATNVAAPITNQPVTLTASVTQSTGTPTGTVQFVDDFGPISGCEAQPVAQGRATCTTTFGADPSLSVLATFTPDGTFAPSNSTGDGSLLTLTFPVGADDSTTALTTSSSTPAIGASVTYVATVAPVTYPGGPVLPAGTVAFFDGTTQIGCAGTDDGFAGDPTSEQATCTTSYAAAGSHSITAQYVGDDPDFNASTSAALTVTVPAGTPAPVTPPPPVVAPAPVAPKPVAGSGTPKVGVAKVSGQAASFAVGCATGGASCTVRAQLTTSVTVRLPGKKGKKGKLVRRTVVLGSATVTVSAGKSKSVKVSLNAAGKKLLAKRHTVKTTLTITRRSGAKTRTVAAKAVTFKAAKAKSKKG